MLQNILAQGHEIGWVRLGLLPVWAALIGWGTNWLAIKLIFRPREPVRILGLPFQGLMHKRHAELASSIGHTVEHHLLSRADVLAIINRPETQALIGTTIDQRVDAFLDRKLAKLHPMVGMFLGGSMKGKLRQTLAEEIRGVIPEFMDQMVARLEQELDFQQIIEEKINAFEMDRLEAIIYGIARRELRAVELLGGVLGFIVGLGQIVIMLL